MGYFFRILLLYYDVYSNDPFNLPLVGGPLTSDPYYFYQAALGYSQGVSSGYGGIFPRVLGVIFKFSCDSRLWAEFWVLLASIGTILVFANIITELDVSNNARIKGMYLISLLPNYAMMSAILRRETVITLFVSISFYYFLKWMKGQNDIKSIILSIVFALVASLFHGATGLIFAGYILVMIIYSPKQKRFILDSKNILCAIAFIAIVLFLYSRYGSVFFDKIEKKLGAGVLASTADKGGSSYAKYVGDAGSPFRILIYAFPRFVYFLFSPFPWQWRGINDSISFLMSSFVYLFIILRSIYYIYKTKTNDFNRKIVINILIVSLITIAVFSWGVTNTGTALRHRDKFIALFCVLFVLTYDYKLPFRIRHNGVK